MDPKDFEALVHKTIEDWIKLANGNEALASGALFAVAYKWARDLGRTPTGLVDIMFAAERKREADDDE